MSAQIIYIKYYVKDEAPAEGERYPDEPEPLLGDDKTFVPSPVSKRMPVLAREEGDADETLHVHEEHAQPRGRSQAV